MLFLRSTFTTGRAHYGQNQPPNLPLWNTCIQEDLQCSAKCSHDGSELVYGVIFRAFCCLLIFFKNNVIFFFRNIPIASIRLDPDKTRRFLGLDLGPNCLQRLSANETSRKELSPSPSNEAIVHTQMVVDCFPAMLMTLSFELVKKRSKI